MVEKSILRGKLPDDLKQAMRSGDTVRRDTLRMLIASVNNAEIAKQSALTDADVLGVVAKEVKRRQESIDAFKKGNRPDLVSKEEAEMAVLQGYLPEQMTRDEIIATAREIITAVGAKGMGDKGKVMQQLMPKLKGKADGKEINDIVTGLLNQ
jgi:uncharacterized protein YqeY